MKIARASISNPLITWLLILACLFGGIWGYATVGRLEDPAFTIKQAVVTTQYPGASAEQVAREVSEPLESVIQQMAEVDTITSTNKPGVSRISVELDTTVPADALPQLWDQLRNKVSDEAARLPDGVRPPIVNDGFGDVYGIYFAVTAPGFTDAEKHELATYLRRELLTVDGVADITLAGLPEETIYVIPDMAILANLGISPEAIIGQVQSASSVARAGSAETGDLRIGFDMPEGTDSVRALAELTVTAGDQVIRLTDIARVERGRDTTPLQMIRHNGQEAFTLAVAGDASRNIVDIGNHVDAKVAEMSADLPVGVDLHPIYRQHEVVDEASNSFLINLAASVAIVVAVLALFMGWRAAVVVGVTLLLTVVGTIFFMSLFSIEMERISLGALIIAMGMLVDNAIVVAEGMQLKMLSGRSSRDAADEAANRVQIPLLGATVIGIMAFSGIGLSQDSTGEFMFSLFAVIGISLLLSWLLALTVTPLLAHYVFRRAEEDGSEAYGGRLFRAYGAILRRAIRLRWLVIAGLVVMTGACFWGFGKVENQFFPDSDTPLFYVHYKLPQGTSMDAVGADLAVAEDWLLEQDDVSAVSTFLGGGATRFMLTYSPEQMMPSYGHLIVRMTDVSLIPALRDRLEAFAAEELPNGEFRTQQLAFGPNSGAPVELRLSGNDPVVLRELSERMTDIITEADPTLLNLRTDWREWEPTMVPLYAADRAGNAGISRADVAQAILIETEGVTVAQYREQDRQIPVVVRSRGTGAPVNVMNQVIWSDAASGYVPLAQVIDGIEIEPRNTMIHRRNRVPTLTIQAEVPEGGTASEAMSRIRGAVEAVDLPAGYNMEWGGEYESSSEAQAGLGTKLPLSFLAMVLISVLLFGKLRQPLIIWLLVPMALNGAVIGLLVTGLPFSFTALLGLLSLSGMLIKNGIVLIEEIDLTRETGLPFDDAVVEASVSRLRPVFLAAATTILGMAPLLGDSFFASMSVTIMGGLAFATVLTMIAAPLLYVMLMRRERKADKASALPA
ncbi:efflux RND transporter permease subunit [Pelagovum pacificum]|uniref:Efflux RND transporter permease subunit n=1 Tax=Pelagovum pacificum TaxID=2588711 RepID=A0A5C5GHP7_9RHOB|nr:efflux RND transporter permease subunit [Pelagovum pacificum]QQA43893.1 efflux RND transporter permease subunit [Pelagovum pacificum]TNY32976.1 efflux RND transporter permease subunit [Pelagovum pacificum]